MNLLGFRKRSLHPTHRRLRTALVRWLSNRPPRTQRVYLVTINGARFKRVVLPDSYAAASVAARLREFGPSGIYPQLVFEKEREVLVEYIEGRRVEGIDTALLEDLASLLATLYKRTPQLKAASDTRWNHTTHVDLHFLQHVGVLSEARYRQLDSLVDRITPEQVWVGYECTDVILKNFVRDDDGRLRCIDVESLSADQLIGSGVAKACVRWLGPHRERFLGLIEKQGVPDFSSYMPFVELSFLAFWVKQSFLEKKTRFVDAELFDRFAEIG